MGCGIWCLNMCSQKRAELLRSFCQKNGVPYESLKPLSGDASLRRYYRGGGLIIADSPPDSQKNDEFAAIAAALKKNGVRVPEIYAFDREHGFILQEDLGDETFAKALASGKRDRKALYFDALELSGKIACASLGPLPPFDREFLEREFGIFSEWFMQKGLGLEPDAKTCAALFEDRDALSAVCQRLPQVPMHRDFHSRNLMIADGSLAVIDFQDMVKGPALYDPASLIFDVYEDLSPEFSQELERKAYDVLKGRGLLKLSCDEYLWDLACVSLQRHVKILGIFSRLWLRDHKDGYLKHLPKVLALCIAESAHCDLKALNACLKGPLSGALYGGESLLSRRVRSDMEAQP